MGETVNMNCLSGWSRTSRPLSSAMRSSVRSSWVNSAAGRLRQLDTVRPFLRHTRAVPYVTITRSQSFQKLRLRSRELLAWSRNSSGVFLAKLV